MHHTKELEENSQKKLTIPETSSEEPLEHSEVANSKNSFFGFLMSVPKIKTIPTKIKVKNLTQHWICRNLTQNQRISVRKSKLHLFKNPLQKWNGIAPKYLNHQDKTKRIGILSE